MHSLRFDGSFATWRQAARRALLQGLAPHKLQWLDEEAAPGPVSYTHLTLPTKA